MLLEPLCAVLVLAAPPRPFTAGPSVEGVTEYGLPNGLRVLLVPDASASSVTVAVTVLVGSRHEGYGEKGLAHLLEHLLFKGTPTYPDPKRLLDGRGARWNGMTSEDRTIYFEALPASDQNLEFALRLEADRLVHAFVAQKDLDTEMTVVRNEFEAGENDGAWALRSRVRAAALPWHNYGRAVIGVRADIERVPVERLQAFYRRYYQPDNAVLVVSGAFDEARALRLIADAFGRIPRPARRLPDTFTTEPTQDGERAVTVRRVGGTPLLHVVWRIPAASHPDFPALMVLQGVLGDQPQGRLHQALVDGHLAAAARCDLDELKEPGLLECTVSFKEVDATAPARAALLELTEVPRPLRDDEVARARDGWLSQTEQQLTRTDVLAFRLSAAAALGDWRLLFLMRDRIATVTTADVRRVWATYLKPQNRSLGEYVPTARPERVEVPPAVDPRSALAGYVGRPAVQPGEIFEATPTAIEARTRRVTLPNGGQLVLVPKRTRAQVVELAVELRLGTAASLAGQQAVAWLTAELVGRGTAKLGYRDLRSTLERLQAELEVHGQAQAVSVTAHTKRPQLDELVVLLAEVLRTPALDARELEVLKGELIAQLEGQRGEPEALGEDALRRALEPRSDDHVLAVLTIPKQIANLKAVTIEQVRAFHRRFYGAQGVVVAVVGDFDVARLQASLSGLLGDWTAIERHERIVEPFVPTRSSVQVLQTPDRANAWLGAGAMVPLAETSPGFPALVLATVALGGSTSARLFVGLREKRGLTYGAYAMLRADPTGERALLTTEVIHAPGNVSVVEAGLREELQRWPTLTPRELELARQALLQARAQARGRDDELASTLAGIATLGRTMAWEAQLDRAFADVTAEQANAAVRTYVETSGLVLVKAGDFKTVSAPQ